MVKMTTTLMTACFDEQVDLPKDAATAQAEARRAFEEARDKDFPPEDDDDEDGSGGRWPIRATFPYDDEQGVLLYETVRFDTEERDQRFRPRRPDGSGGWIWNLEGVRWILYRLRELIARVARG